MNGLVSDTAPYFIPEEKSSDCMNVCIKNNVLKSRSGLSAIGEKYSYHTDLYDEKIHTSVSVDSNNWDGKLLICCDQNNGYINFIRQYIPEKLREQNG